MLWIRAGGSCVWVGETVWNTLNEGGTEKSGGEAKILKKKGKAGLRNGYLKKGAGISLRNYDGYIYIVAGFFFVFVFIYLLFVSHWPLLFYNDIAIHCKMLHANLSQQLHTIETN